ncbi:MAG TPA: two-component regulator propeller domain-containing protein, partial [Tepidisphaeraceae bacterium]|nr:two-component regulator propeller domain-containing protein [Tepidisphaeraceae bacterium]
WAATDSGGLLYLRDGQITRYTVNQGLPSDSVRDLLLDRDGVLWVSTQSGLASIGKGSVRRYGAAEGLPATSPRALCEASDGSIWVGSDGPGLMVWNGSRFVPRALSLLPPDAAVRAIVCSPDGALWFGTTAGLIRLKDGKDQRFTEADGLADDWVYCVCSGLDGSIYAGTKDGFSRFRDGKFETFRTRDGLSQSTVYSLCHDREGSLWVGTKYGLNQFMNRRTIPFTTAEGLPSNDTGPVFQDASGTVWIGTIGAGLSWYDGRKFSTALTTGDGLSSNVILSLTGDQQGNLWVGTNHGLDRLRDKKVEQTFTTAQGLPSDTINCLLSDDAGTLWVGTGGGLAELRNGTFTQPAGADGPLRAAVIALCRRRDGAILVATRGGGLHAIVSGVVHPVPQEDLPPRDIDCFFEDADGLLWMGTRSGGLRLIEGNKTVSYSVRDGLYDDDIYGIVQDQKNDLWMACSKGMFSVSRNDLLKFARREILSFASTPFSPMDALRTIECTPGVQPAACRMDDGLVWFSTIHGVLAIDPEHPRKLPPFPVVVEDLIVNGTSVNPMRVSRLPPGDTNLEFQYAGLSFIVPTRMTYRYRLDGFDKDWVEAGNRREAFYTNLRPGNYQFRVMAQNVDGTWSQSVTPLGFTLLPHFYQRREFTLICALFVAALVWVSYRMRVGRIREHLHAVVAERSRIARELHDTLMQGFAGITMEMQALSFKLPDSGEKGTLDEIIRDAGTCLREARQSIAGLRTTPSGTGSGLVASLTQTVQQLTEARGVRLKLKLNELLQPLPPDVEYNLLRIAQEAVSNSVKHSGARSIEVGLDSNSRSLRLCVKDDGSGMKNGNGDNCVVGHYGLIGMKERATQIGADLQINSEPGRGTTVSVSVPVHPHSNGPSV